MRLYICEICGDATIASEKPADCPFCGAKSSFIKLGSEAKPITDEKIPISEVSMKNLKETYQLEINAVGIYNCMANFAETYAVKAMYKRLAKVELEHATIVTKLAGMPKPRIPEKSCRQNNAENFKKTIKLEEHAADVYQKFLKAASEKNIKILFTALIQAETGHIELIKGIM